MCMIEKIKNIKSKKEYFVMNKQQSMFGSMKYTLIEINSGKIGTIGEDNLTTNFTFVKYCDLKGLV